MVINDDHFLNTTVPAELIVQIPFRCADAQTEYPQHAAWIGGLGNRSISDPRTVPSLQLTMGA